MKNKSKYYIYQMNITALNIISVILLLVALLVPALIDIDFFKSSVSFVFSGANFAIFMIMYIFYMILHELLHSLSYVLFGAKFDKVLYGAAIEKGVLYCLCKQNISRKNILNSLMFPFIFIGIITFIIAMIFKLPYLLFLSIFNISGCAGDVIMFLFIRKLDKEVEYTEFDDPISFGIYSKDDITNVKHFGLNYINVQDDVKREDLKKINISKVSKITFIVLALLLIILLVIDKVI